MIEKTEKPYTLRSVQRELEKLEKSKEKKKEKIKSLTEEIKSENAKIKELETIYDKLYHEDLQRKISDAWFKHGNITGEQIIKILELSKQIQDKIDILDVDTMVNAVTVAYHEHTKKQNETETL